MKQTIKITESELNRIIKDTIEEVLSKKKKIKSGFHIKDENKGAFKRTQEKTGKTTSELLNSPNKLTAKRANFARMAKRGWKPLKKSK